MTEGILANHYSRSLAASFAPFTGKNTNAQLNIQQYKNQTKEKLGNDERDFGQPLFQIPGWVICTNKQKIQKNKNTLLNITKAGQTWTKMPKS